MVLSCIMYMYCGIYIYRRLVVVLSYNVYMYGIYVCIAVYIYIYIGDWWFSRIMYNILRYIYIYT